MVTGCVSVGKLGESEVFRVTQASLIPLKGPQTMEEEKVSELRKLLNGGTFYFYWSAAGEPNDITLCAQKIPKNPGTDNRFFWNRSDFCFIFSKSSFPCILLLQASSHATASLWYWLLSLAFPHHMWKCWNSHSLCWTPTVQGSWLNSEDLCSSNYIFFLLFKL